MSDKILLARRGFIAGALGGVVGLTNAAAQSRQPLQGLSLSAFGAVGDGRTDDTAAIAVALRQGAQSRQPVLVPQGRFIYNADRLSGAVPPWFRVFGTGAQSVLECRGDAQFQVVDGFEADGLTILAGRLLPQDPATPRNRAPSGVFLFDNLGKPVRTLRLGPALVMAGNNTPANGSARHEGYLRLSGGHDFGDVLTEAQMDDVITGIWMTGRGRFRGAPRFHNVKTGVILTSGITIKADVRLINTPEQQRRYRTTSNVPSSYNGANAVLVEATTTPTSNIRLSIYAEHPIERGGYLQNVRNGEIICTVNGGEGLKLVDGSSNLRVVARARLTANTPARERGDYQNPRFALQTYGGKHGPVENIDCIATLDNQRGTFSNEVAFQTLGACRNIRAEVEGTSLGHGLYLIPNAMKGIFTPRLDGISITRGHYRGRVGPNGAINAAVKSNEPGYELGSISVANIQTPPASIAEGRVVTLRGWRSATAQNIQIDGVTDPAERHHQVAILD